MIERGEIIMAEMKVLSLLSRNKQGQSIIEYLVVVGVIIGAIIAIKSGGLQASVETLLNTSANRIEAAKGNKSAPAGEQGLAGLTGNWPQGM